MMNLDNHLGLRAYYKGTSLQAPVINRLCQAFHEHVVKNGEAQVVSFLRKGHTLSEIKSLLTEQMDVMEDGLRRTQKASDVWKEGDQDAWMAEATAGTSMEGSGQINVILWFLNIAALLKLGAIANDNNNGWLMIQVA